MPTDRSEPPGAVPARAMLRAASTRLAALPRPLLAALMMLAATVLIAAMHAIVRSASATYHPFEIAFFRNAFGLVVFLPFLWRGGLKVLHTERLHLHAARAGLQIFAMLMFFSAIALLPLAKVSALSFSSPLFAAIAAVVLLGERMRLRRVTALIIGFIGALIIIRPGAVSLDVGSLLIVASSAVWAVAITIVKRLSATDSSITITAYMNLFLTPLSLVPALFVWRWPTLPDYGWLLAMAVMGTIAHILMAQSLKYADATAVLPYDFARLLWASLFGLVFFAEVPSIWTIAGAILIFASSTYIAYREARVGAAGVVTAGAPKAPT